ESITLYTSDLVSIHHVAFRLVSLRESSKSALTSCFRVATGGAACPSRLSAPDALRLSDQGIVDTFVLGRRRGLSPATPVLGSTPRSRSGHLRPLVGSVSSGALPTTFQMVCHDIGLTIAYGYTAQFPNDVEKLVLMDAFLPGVEGWEPIYNS